MARLASELKSLGYDGSPNEFRDILAVSMFNLYPSWTDEKLTRNPDHAKVYCNHVRHAVRLELSDEFILGTLTNIRKHALTS